jgi:transposase InsO family protein
MSLWRDVDNNVLKSVFQNFALKGAILGYPRQTTLSEKYGCNTPTTILIDPASASNLKCTGCWAAEYGNKLNMSYETLDGIVKQGKELSVHFYLYRTNYHSKSEFYNRIEKYIEFYDTKRPHVTLDYKSPNTHERLFFDRKLKI